MKKLVFIVGVMGLLVGLLVPAAALADGSVTNSYSDVTLSSWGSGNLPEVWDLTTCDLTLSYTIDMSGIANAGWAVTEVGLRELCGPNIDPNLQGGWMQSNYVLGASNPNSLNNNDMHLLSKHGWSLQYYDAEDADNLVSPYWSGANYGFWFDRDGVDQWQAAMWGMVDGDIYNTCGEYEIVINYHAIDNDNGTMFATINGVQQGLYVGGWKDAEPEFYPAGRSFEGDMTQMQVFYGRGGGGGTVELSDITATGCLRMVIIDGCDTGVVDQVSDGCNTISGEIAQCAADASNHGEFVKCVSHLTNELKKAGCITGEEKGKIVSCAAKADIP
ncbi:MAG: hypothetical protein JW732_09915 [Dehalococcoidia bacterium]|nr:hypothetical protein [Dehalococcoidia bacterium]